MPAVKQAAKRIKARSKRKRSRASLLAKARAARWKKIESEEIPKREDSVILWSYSCTPMMNDSSKHTATASTSGDLPASNEPSISDCSNNSASESAPSESDDRGTVTNCSTFSNTTLEELRQLNDTFIKARNWDQFHSPRNVLLAMVGEVGELAEIFQWKGEVSEGLPELSPDEREHVSQEVSDILIYLIDFASRCKIDLPAAALKKMEANAKKYPADKAYGKANKYTDYQ